LASTILTIPARAFSGEVCSGSPRKMRSNQTT